MRNDILKLLESKETSVLTIEEIYNLLGLNTTEDCILLKKELDKLVYEKELYLSKHNKYLLITNSHFIQGKMLMNPKGFGFVEVPDLEDDVYISSDNVNNARHNDEVLIEIVDKKRNEGKVIKVLKRDDNNIVGEFYTKEGKNYVKPDKKGYMDIEIPRDKTLGAVPGHKVVVKPLGNDNYKGEILTIIGHKNDVGVDILSFVYNNNFKPQFPSEVMTYLDNIPLEISEEDTIGRLDLRDEMIFTIDGDDTKDIDDAISVKKNEDGTYELGVHIADVSHYVKKGSILDVEAYERGTSVYLVDRVIPMLPHKLSNGICSLNPEVDRLALSCIMKLDNKGNVISKIIKPSVIRSRKQMTYNNVNKILEENVVPEGYEIYEKDLRLMNEISNILRKKMVSRGYLEFKSNEAKIIVDDNCHPIDIKVREQKTGECLIENFMIVANETVSEYIESRNLPSIYRVHDKPNQAKLASFIGFLSKKGIVINGKLDKIKAKDIQQILNELKDRPDAKILNDFAVRSQSKAVYSDENIGHFGLGSKSYAHFTSPIRRYPDLTLHRLIKDYDYHYSDETVNSWREELPEICEHTSIKEQDAVNCERDVDKMKKAEYMEDHVGEVFTGVISGVTDFGLFIELDNTVEGLVKIEQLVDDQYYYIEKEQALIGKRKKRKYMFGDMVEVKVIGASKVNYTVDFEIVNSVRENAVNEKKSKKKSKKR